MVKSGGAAALVFVLSLLLGACASSGSILRMELPQFGTCQRQWDTLRD